MIINESSSERKFKCPYCNYKGTRERLVSHVENNHKEMIPEGYTAARVVFNSINHKEVGHCVQCKVNETKWNEDTWRYERFCSDKCRDAYVKMAKERMVKKYGKTNLLNDEEQQKKMLANRRISGTYKFRDGGERTYCGSYEKKTLEFYDKVLNVPSKDIMTPGPTVIYDYEGKKHKWITDIYYVPFNLVHDIKDGGSNPNKRKMDEYRAKQSAKEEAIVKQKQYNYIRLTDNNFSQLLLILAELKEQMIDDSDNKTERIVAINETSVNSKLDPNFKKGSKYSISSYKKIDISDKIIKQYKPKYKELKHIRIGGTYKGYLYIDKDELVALLNVDTEKKEIQALEIMNKYKGHGLSKQLLDIATNDLQANSLWVNKNNEVALNIYSKYGFKEVSSSGLMIKMQLKDTINESYSKPYTEKEIEKKYGKKIKERLMKDPCHKYRATTGIELIHKEPTEKELDRIWKNWNQMTPEQKIKSDKKCKELFGKDNKTLYIELKKSYKSINENNKKYEYETGIDILEPRMDLNKATRYDATDENRIYYHIPKRKLKTGDKYKGFIYVDKLSLVGFINVFMESHFIDNLEVYSPYEGMGIIPQMISQAVKELGAKNITVRRSNKALTEFVKALGFEKYRHTSTMDYYTIKDTNNEACAAVMAAIPPLNPNIYVAGYPAPNVFTKALELCTDKYGTNTVKYKDGKLKKSKISIDDNVQLYKYKGKRNINKIVKEIYEDMNNGIEVEPSYIYEAITGRIMMTPDQIEYDEDFEKVNDGFTEAKYKSQIECATLVHQFIHELTKTDFKFDIVDHVLKDKADEILKDYDNLTIRQDAVGRFMVINKLDGKCSNFYYTLDEIPRNILPGLNEPPKDRPDMIEEDVKVLTKNDFNLPIYDAKLLKKKDNILHDYHNLDIMQDSVGRFIVINNKNNKISPYYDNMDDIPEGMLRELNKGDGNSGNIQYEEPKRIGKQGE